MKKIIMIAMLAASLTACKKEQPETATVDCFLADEGSLHIDNVQRVRMVGSLLWAKTETEAFYYQTTAGELCNVH